MTRILQGILILFILGAIGSFFADEKDGNKKTANAPSVANSNSAGESSSKKVYEYKSIINWAELNALHMRLLFLLVLARKN